MFIINLEGHIGSGKSFYSHFLDQILSDDYFVEVFDMSNIHQSCVINGVYDMNLFVNALESYIANKVDEVDVLIIEKSIIHMLAYNLKDGTDLRVYDYWIHECISIFNEYSSAYQTYVFFRNYTDISVNKLMKISHELFEEYHMDITFIGNGNNDFAEFNVYKILGRVELELE